MLSFLPSFRPARPGPAGSDGKVYVRVANSSDEEEARVVKADVPFGMGVVHVVDKVLLPPVNVTLTRGG